MFGYFPLKMELQLCFFNKNGFNHLKLPLSLKKEGFSYLKKNYSKEKKGF